MDFSRREALRRAGAFAIAAPTIASLQPAHGMAILFISHDLAAVGHLAQRVVVLERGRIADGRP